MEESQGFNHYVYINKFLMKKIGVWPNYKESVPWQSHSLFLSVVFILLFFDIVPQTYGLFFVYNDFDAFVETLMAGDIVETIACIKLIAMWANIKDFRYLLIVISKDWNVTAKYNQSVMRANAKLNELLARVNVFCVLGTVILYGLLNIFVVNANVGKINEFTNETISRQMLLISKFFFDVQKSPIFEICWIGQQVTTLYAGFSYSAFDGFFLLVMLHACGQLTILSYDLKKLITMNHQSNLSFGKSLGVCVRKQEEIYRFIECVERNFNATLFFIILGFCVSFCLQGYQAMMMLTGESAVNTFKILFITIFSSGNLLLTFIYCYMAEQLHEKCMNLFYTPYDTDWYYLETVKAKMLLNIMWRTKKLPQITAGKVFPFSLEYFMSIVKTSVGYISMLFAMKQKMQY